ncbi:hypothetical protein FOZ62_000477, partial [Perkinsus olseni]
MDMALRYAYAMKTYFLGITFAPVLPVLLPLVAFGLTLQYCSSKYLLLRKCKRPYTQSAALAKQAMFLVELSSVLLTVMGLIFIRPSMADSQLPTFRAQMSTWRQGSSAATAATTHSVLGNHLQSILQRAQTQALQGNFNEAITNCAVNAAEVEFVGGQDITVDQTPMGCWIGSSAVGNTAGASLIGRSAGSWEWRNSAGEWLPLPHAAALIADEAQRCGVPNTVIELGNETFMANVVDGTMISLLTQQKTDIRR